MLMVNASQSLYFSHKFCNLFVNVHHSGLHAAAKSESERLRTPNQRDKWPDCDTASLWLAVNPDPSVDRNNQATLATLLVVQKALGLDNPLQNLLCIPASTWANLDRRPWTSQ